MKIPTLMPSMFFVAILGLAAVVCAQTPPLPDACPCGRSRNPLFDAALKACESQLGGSPQHPVAFALMAKCMDAKGFKRPPGLPPGPPPGLDNPPPPPPASGS
ncbi:hypothetical protein HDE78_000607 [Rhodanobacter sp. K2T2]|jgi:hypothetical protein|uniref:hypothetical protein n=1 Tax=Rhodanobacter sp. K2T2 TaxID=2723085 RepID=UPI0015C82289|nr:hypothetical protein [Rhodanobacter sp. K2T2]NYE27682.1 hypothetical protein [Rhodanobacter sp. K2T2]